MPWYGVSIVTLGAAFIVYLLYRLVEAWVENVAESQASYLDSVGGYVSYKGAYDAAAHQAALEVMKHVVEYHPEPAPEKGCACASRPKK